MEIIEQKVERLYETGIDLVARAARICYRSQGNPENNEAFVKGLIKKGHLSPLEFWRLDCNWFTSGIDRTHYNFREHYGDNETYNEEKATNTINVCKQFTDHEDWIALEITTNIGIARELMRHRAFSYCQESTRYVNYRQKGEICFIPFDNTTVYGTETQIMSDGKYRNIYEIIERSYNALIANGIKPEIARGLLPLDTATRLVMGGFKSDWEQMIKLRLEETAGKVHPQMKELAQLIKNELKK